MTHHKEQTTTLNLIAIAVFLMTLSVLLGPMLHLPPAIPATIVLVVLGLATADSFAFQGQGGAILLDVLEGRSSQTRDRIVHHEAGHFLVAYLMGIPVSGYALSAWEAFRQGQPAQGGVRFNDQELIAQLEQGQLSAQLLERYCKVWMAGIAAEQFVYQQAVGGQDDRQKIQGVWRQLQCPLAEAQMKERWATLQAHTLITNHQSAYEALVEALKQRMSIPECYRILEQQLESTS